MPRRRRVNLRKITPERDGEQFARRHAACPWKVEWREPATRKVKRRFLADEHRARRIQRKIEDTINTYDPDIIAYNVRLEFVRDQFLQRAMSDASRTEYARSINAYGRLTFWQTSDAWTVKSIDMFIRRRSRETKGKKHPRPISPQTVNKDLRHLSAMFSWCVARNYLDENPFDRLPRGEKQIRTTHTIKPIWTSEQLAQVLDCCDREWKIAVLLILTGVGRSSAVRRLTIGDVDLSAKTILIRETKTGKEKLAPIHPMLLAELTTHIAEMPAGRERLIQCDLHSRSWKNICARARVPHITMHRLRACLATWLAESGVRDDDIAVVLDHSSAAVTRRHYQSLDDLRVRRAALEKLTLK